MSKYTKMTDWNVIMADNPTPPEGYYDSLDCRDCKYCDSIMFDEMCKEIYYTCAMKEEVIDIEDDIIDCPYFEEV